MREPESMSGIGFPHYATGIGRRIGRRDGGEH
jgi:hypothetical protein